MLDIKNTVFFKLAKLSFAILFPIILLLIAYSFVIFFSVSDQIYEENKLFLSTLSSQFDTSLKAINTKLFQLIEDSEMTILRQSDSDNSNNKLEWYGARNYILNLYEEYILEYPILDGVYNCITYSDGGHEFLISTAPGRTPMYMADKVRDYVNSYVENTDVKKHVGLQWENVVIDGKNYVFLLRHRGNCYFGGWFDADYLLNYWGLDGRGYCIFDKEDRKIISSLQNEYERVAESLPEGNFLKEDKRVIAIVSEQGNFGVGQVIDKSLELIRIPKVVLILSALSIFSVFFISLYFHYAKKNFYYPLEQLIKGMNQVEKGNVTYQIPDVDYMEGEFALLGRNFNRMVLETQRLKIETYEHKLEKQRIKMQYLSQQIQPHFILNTLNILYCYGQDEFHLIRKMILCMAKYFRYVVKINADFVELKLELEHIQNYFQIQQARYPDTFVFHVDMEEGISNAAIPPLLIQNFAENAVKYSLSTNHQVTVDVTARRGSQNEVVITISDTGRGFSGETLAAIGAFYKEGCHQETLGVGIENAIQRLGIMYQGKAGIEFTNNETGGALITVILPYTEVQQEVDEEE